MSTLLILAGCALAISEADHASPSVCVASIVRIVMMNKLVHSQDFTWAMCQVFIWSCVEPFIGILCACLPTYAPLVRHWYSATTSQLSKGPRSSSYNISTGNFKIPAQRSGPRAIQRPLDATLWGDDEIELTANNGNGGKGYTYEVHTVSSSKNRKSGQNIHVQTDYSFSRST